MALTKVGGIHGLYVDAARNNYRAGAVLGTTGVGAAKLINSLTVYIDKTSDSDSIQKENLLARIASMGYSRSSFEKKATFTFNSVDDRIEIKLIDGLDKESASALISLVAWYASDGDANVTRIGEAIWIQSRENFVDLPFPLSLADGGAAFSFSGATLSALQGIMRFTLIDPTIALETHTIQGVTLSNEDTNTVIKVEAASDAVFVAGRAGMEFIVTVGTKLVPGTYQIIGNEVVAGVSSAIWLTNPNPGVPVTIGADTLTATVNYQSYLANEVQAWDNFKHGFYILHKTQLDTAWVSHDITTNAGELTVFFDVAGSADRYELVNSWIVKSDTSPYVTGNTFALLSNAIAYIGKSLDTNRTFYGY